MENSKNMEPIKGKFVQRFWRFTIWKSIGGFTGLVFRTESLTGSVNVDQIRKELNEKFSSDQYTVIEHQWDVIQIENGKF